MCYAIRAKVGSKRSRQQLVRIPSLRDAARFMRKRSEPVSPRAVPPRTLTSRSKPAENSTFSPHLPHTTYSYRPALFSLSSRRSRAAATGCCSETEPQHHERAGLLALAWECGARRDTRWRFLRYRLEKVTSLLPGGISCSRGRARQGTARGDGGGSGQLRRALRVQGGKGRQRSGTERTLR